MIGPHFLVQQMTFGDNMKKNLKTMYCWENTNFLYYIKVFNIQILK
jgi:hypothetical protein